LAGPTEERVGSSTLDMVSLSLSRYAMSYVLSRFFLGITPFVNPEDLRFFFQEVHRLTKTST